MSRSFPADMVQMLTHKFIYLFSFPHNNDDNNDDRTMDACFIVLFGMLRGSQIPEMGSAIGAGRERAAFGERYATVGWWEYLDSLPRTSYTRISKKSYHYY